MKIFKKQQRQITAYWWLGRPNWGDLLTPLLLAHYCEIQADWAPIGDASLVAVGSIIEHIPNGWKGRIIGAGKLHEQSLLPVGPEILALRGPLTAHGIRGDFVLGDLGLLANELVTVETKKYKLGIVPHWSDEHLPKDPRFTKYDHVVIDPRGDPLDVIRIIGECEKIVSSSLHGIILADAFAIPRRIEYASRLNHEGGVFKFRDYSQSIRTPFVIGKTMCGDRRAIDDCKSSLYDVLRALA